MKADHRESMRVTVGPAVPRSSRTSIVLLLYVSVARVGDAPEGGTYLHQSRHGVWTSIHRCDQTIAYAGNWKGMQLFGMYLQDWGGPQFARFDVPVHEVMRH